MRTHDGAAFLSWARFPRFITQTVGDSIRVRMSDLRYEDRSGRGWASLEIMVPAEPSTPAGVRIPSVEPDTTR